MDVLKALNLLLAFLLEIALVVMASYWGFHQQNKYLLGIGLAAVIIILWGILAAPKSKFRLKNPYRTIVKVFLLSGSVLFSYDTGHPVLAFCLAALILFNVGAAYTFGQDY